MELMTVVILIIVWAFLIYRYYKINRMIDKNITNIRAELQEIHDRRIAIMKEVRALLESTEKTTRDSESRHEKP